MSRTHSKSPITLDRVLNVLIVIGVIAALGLAVSILAPDVTKQFGLKSQSEDPQLTAAPELVTYTISDITVHADVSEEVASMAVDFVKQSLTADFVPPEITIQKAQDANEQTGPAHIANWNKDGMYISLLMGLTRDGAAVEFLRAWYMPTGDTTNASEAKKLLEAVFEPAYVSTDISLNCRSVASPDGSGDITECSQMKTDEANNLRGFTVRAPIILAPPEGTQLPPGVTPQKTIAVSACFVPAVATPAYPADTCL